MVGAIERASPLRAHAAVVIPSLVERLESPSRHRDPGGPALERPTSGWPVLVTTLDGECFAFAAPGGNRVLCALTQAVVNVVNFGLDVETALAAPRIDCGSTPVARRLVICDARMPSATGPSSDSR